MHVVAIIQARMRSYRLSGKVLMDIDHRPLLCWTADRAQRARCVDEVVVATSTGGCDDCVEYVCEKYGFQIFRGSEDDVLGRYCEAARNYDADHIVRLTADCPFLDPALIDRVVEKHLESKADYTSNALKRTFPKGLDTEVVRASVLAQLDAGSRTERHRTHPTSHIMDNLSEYKTSSVENPVDRSSCRWTVDYYQDIEFARELVSDAVFDLGYVPTAWTELYTVQCNHPSVAKLNRGLE